MARKRDLIKVFAELYVLEWRVKVNKKSGNYDRYLFYEDERIKKQTELDKLVEEFMKENKIGLSEKDKEE